MAEVAGGVAGAMAVHIETGRQASLNPAVRFPMASTFKVPVAVELLHRVDQDQEHLDRMITLRPSDLHPGSGTLTALFNQPGVSLSVRNLLELMLLISDNSAADICLRLAGGPGAVNARMRQLGIGEIEVDRPTANLIADAVGIDKLPPEEQWTPQMFRDLMRAVPADTRTQALRQFDADPRDRPPLPPWRNCSNISGVRMRSSPIRQSFCSTSCAAARPATPVSKACSPKASKSRTRPAPSA